MGCDPHAVYGSTPTPGGLWVRYARTGGGHSTLGMAAPSVVTLTRFALSLPVAHCIAASIVLAAPLSAATCVHRPARLIPCAVVPRSRQRRFTASAVSTKRKSHQTRAAHIAWHTQRHVSRCSTRSLMCCGTEDAYATTTTPGGSWLRHACNCGHHSTLSMAALSVLSLRRGLGDLGCAHCSTAPTGLAGPLSAVTCVHGLARRSACAVCSSRAETMHSRLAADATQDPIKRGLRARHVTRRATAADTPPVRAWAATRMLCTAPRLRLAACGCATRGPEAATARWAWRRRRWSL